MAGRVRFRILTPMREVFAGEVDSVTLTAKEGEIGILPGHAALLAELRPGEASLKDGATTRHFALADGFVEVSDDDVTALVRAAEGSDEIDVARAEERRKEREEQLREAELSEHRMRAAQISLEKQFVRIRVANRSN